MSAALLLLIGLAQAKDDGFLRPEGTDCDLNGGNPIAGTAGFENARDALQTNQNTWSATAFAERTLFPAARRKGAEEEGGVAAFSWTFTFNAASVVTADPGAEGNGNCPSNYRVQVRPLDMQAGNIGVAGNWGKWGLFYSSSVTFGQLAYPNPFLRGMLWVGAVPMYAGSIAALAPISRGWATQEGASAFAMDWIAGGRYEGPHGYARLGWAGSRGLYLDVGEDTVGLGISGVVRPSAAGWLGQLWAGGRRMPLKKLAEPLGMSSVFLRDLSFGPPVVESVAASAADGGLDGVLGGVGRLRTLHVEQEDIADLVDLRVAMATRPISQLHLAAAGLHSKGFRATRDGQAGEGFLGQVGVVNLPAQPILGVDGGTYFSARVEGRARSKDGKMGGGGSVLFNDPELLALYPFATNVSSWSLHFEGAF
jgi:hypothetical protein